ncbi:hypothetical protein BDZ97DRAFT_717570 [Flammula alnicola]|nr:hypothetical protein BDZ97DRAFT_717570 [Flammula alnicola]
MEVARLMMKDVLADSMSSSPSYKIRDDSYTDKNTGVTRVYVRQLVNGLEVVDGDMNINIKDGTVLSYGNSKFTNPTISAVPALLEFMATFGGHSTAPDSSAEPTDAMKVIPVHRVVPDEISVEYTIDNVHGAVSPVKAKLAYAQVRNKAASDTELLLVWKFEVEMRNNSYEATVSASAPYKVISVVDRVASFRKG